MPFVSDAEAQAAGLASGDLYAIAASLGPPPWRVAVAGTAGIRAVLLHWEPGFRTVPHLHPHADEVFLVLRGRAGFTIGAQQERMAGAGTFLGATRGMRHVIRVPDGGEPLLLLAAVAPNEDRPDETIDVP
jgi:mannose-6-phosphate isomerase-like protein (cupin superfamily)